MLRIYATCLVLTTAYHPALLYYDYLLTFDRERRLFWSRRSFKQWGSLLFFLNRYCGVLGHAPVIIQTFSPPESAPYRFCPGLRLYHQILAIVMQTIVGGTPSRITSMDSQRLNSTLLGSHFHHEDLCLVRQKSRGSFRTNHLGSRCHCAEWRESWLLKTHLSPR